MPFPGAAEELAASLGLIFHNGYTRVAGTEEGGLTFRRSDGSLREHSINVGRNPGERVSSVTTFTGQAFRPHPDTKLEPLMVLGDDVELIGLKLNDFEVPQHLPVEALCRSRGTLEPACDGVAGTSCETGRGRNAHALDSQARYLVELPPSAAKTGIRRTGIRADGCPAYLATVTPSATRLGGKPAVATDLDAPLSKVLAAWLGARLVLDGPHD